MRRRRRLSRDFNRPARWHQHSGFLEFFGLDAGSYTLSIETSVIGGTAQPSAANVGSDDTIDSDGQANGTTSAVSFVKTDSDKVAYDFGSTHLRPSRLTPGRPATGRTIPKRGPTRSPLAI
jgi:hypothetical protein